MHSVSPLIQITVLHLYTSKCLRGDTPTIRKILLSISSGFMRFNLITELFRAIITVLLLTDKSIMLDGGLKINQKIIVDTK